MNRQPSSLLSTLLKSETTGGALLLLSGVLALICANTPLRSFYELLISTPVVIRIGALEIAKPLLLWINDGLMAIFFFVIGLELKRELVAGELADRRNIILPGVGAIGGMVVPALIYTYFNSGDPFAMQGWAIPAATDIAFALGVLSLFGKRVPPALKVFLISLAIFDDVGAILIIAIFYTAQISLDALFVAGCCLPILALFNHGEVDSKGPYLLVGVIVWVALLKSGVHATLAGVLLAMFIPLRSSVNPDLSPLKELEHNLHTVVTFFILPAFAFANTGISFQGMGVEHLLHSVPVGIALGLFAGKQIGIFGVCWLVIQLKFANLPKDMTWRSLYGTATLCGIGFTMSLFIGSLAFEETGIDHFFDERVGIFLGSAVSGIVGALILRSSLLLSHNNHQDK